MFFNRSTLDDLMAEILPVLLQRPTDVSSSRGKSAEIVGAMIHLTNPLARISRTETKGKAFSALGELLWYLSKTKDLEFISYYIPSYIDESVDQKTIYGGYGPRIFNLRDSINQMENVISLLKNRPTTRKAVIQIFDGEDLVESHPELPCTCTIQFLIRNNQLHVFTSMRSNDAFLGLPHDIFAFTMIQEIVAKSLNVDLGIYTHSVGSLHLYESHIQKANQYLNEGTQSTQKMMPEMPNGDPWQSIEQLVAAEKIIRNGGVFDETAVDLDPYWLDMIRLLKVFARRKVNDYEGIKEIKKNIYYPIYNAYIDSKIITKKKVV